MKPSVIVGVCVAAFTAYVGMAVVRAIGQDPDPSNESRSFAGLALAKDQGIRLDLAHRNRAQVGLGSYLVNSVGGCNDCHTAPPYTLDPSAGLGAPKQINIACYLAGGQSFGPFVSRDITPWENGRPAGLTFAQFEHVIRTGEDPDNPGQVLQVMPWPVYQGLTDNDLRAIYEYLSAIPAIPVNTCGDPSER